MTIEQSLKEFLKKLSIQLGIFDADLELAYDTDVLITFIENVKDNLPLIMHCNI